MLTYALVSTVEPSIARESEIQFSCTSLATQTPSRGENRDCQNGRGRRKMSRIPSEQPEQLASEPVLEEDWREQREEEERKLRQLLLLFLDRRSEESSPGVVEACQQLLELHHLLVLPCRAAHKRHEQQRVELQRHFSPPGNELLLSPLCFIPRGLWQRRRRRPGQPQVTQPRGDMQRFSSQIPDVQASTRIYHGSGANTS